MKVKMPMFSVEARGTVGGLTYNTWRGINYVKTCTSPTGQGTGPRLIAQALMIAVSKLWAGIGDTQRAAWNQYAADHPVTNWTGTPERLTGMNWFMRCHISLRRMGFPYMVQAPTVAAPSPITGLTFEKVSTYLELSWATPNTGLWKIDIWMVGPLSHGIAPKIQRAKFLQYNPVLDYGGIILVNNPAVGRWTVFARVIDDATGLTSSWLSKFVDVV